MENTGQDEIIQILENSRYVYPQVMDIKSVEIDWTDDHPLNKNATVKEEFEKLFK